MTAHILAHVGVIQIKPLTITVLDLGVKTSVLLYVLLEEAIVRRK